MSGGRLFNRLGRFGSVWSKHVFNGGSGDGFAPGDKGETELKEDGGWRVPMFPRVSLEGGVDDADGAADENLDGFVQPPRVKTMGAMAPSISGVAPEQMVQEAPVELKTSPRGGGFGRQTDVTKAGLAQMPHGRIPPVIGAVSVIRSPVNSKPTPGLSRNAVKARLDFSNDEIDPDVLDDQGRPGDWANPDRYVGIRDASFESFQSGGEGSKQGFQTAVSGSRDDEMFARQDEIPGDDEVIGEVSRVFSDSPTGLIKAHDPVGTVKAPRIKGFVPGALKLIISQDRALPNEPKISRDQSLTRDQAQYLRDWVTLNLRSRLPGFDDLTQPDRDRMVREGIDLYYDPDKLDVLWSTGDWSVPSVRRHGPQKLPDAAKFSDPASGYNALMPSEKAKSPLDAAEWPKYRAMAEKIVDTHPFFRVPDPNSSSDEPVQPIKGTRRMDYIHRVALQLAGVTQEQYDRAMRERDAGHRGFLATLGASWFGTSTQGVGTLLKSLGADRLGEFYQETGSELLEDGVDPNYTKTRDVGQTLGGITPAVGLYAAGGFPAMLVGGTLMAGRSAYDRGRDADLSGSRLTGYVGLHMLSSVMTMLAMRRFAPASSPGAAAHGAAVGGLGNEIANTIDRAFIDPNIPLGAHGRQAVVGGAITGYLTQGRAQRPGGAKSAGGQSKSAVSTLLGMEPAEFQMLRARLKAVKHLDETALRKMGARDPAGAKRALEKLSRMGDIETPEGVWRASAHPEFMASLRELVASFEKDASASGRTGREHDGDGPRTSDVSNGALINEALARRSGAAGGKIPQIPLPSQPLPIDFIMDSQDKAGIYASRRNDIDPNGMLDVTGHGNSNLVKWGKIPVDAKRAAEIIKRDPQYRGQPIRLLSCSTGSRPDGFAQQLANQLGVTVLAPNDFLWPYPDGRFTIGPGEWVDYPNGIRKFEPRYPHNGKFVPFNPQNNP